MLCVSASPMHSTVSSINFRNEIAIIYIFLTVPPDEKTLSHPLCCCFVEGVKPPRTRDTNED